MRLKMARWLALALALPGCDWLFPEPEPEIDFIEPACLQVSRETLDFGTVRVDGRTSDVIRVINDCGDDGSHASVHIADAFFEGETDAFQLELADSGTVTHGQAALFKVVFSPFEPGPVDDVFHIVTDDPENPEILIPASGTGTVPSVSLEAERFFVAPLLGCEGVIPVDVVNAGEGPVRIDRVYLEAEEPVFDVDHRLDDNGSGPWELGPGGRLSVDVVALPSDFEPVSAVVRVRADDPWAAQVSLEVQATAQPFRDATDVFRYALPESGDEGTRFVLDEAAVPASVRAFRDEFPLTEFVYAEPDGTAVWVLPNDALEPDDLFQVYYEVQPDCDAQPEETP